jgi:murein DD-endopeptidase MepM/ murein hydrolase activator NlpD
VHVRNTKISRIPSALAAVVAAAAAVGAAVAGPGAAAAVDCWLPPVRGHVVDPFRPPACPWCPGNRGLEYRIGTDVDVHAVDDGVVTFAGAVAGTRYVVVATAGGERVTYGRLDDVDVEAGDEVRAGRRVGTASGVFFLGLRDGESYLDPAPRLGRLVFRPRLVPLDGSAARAAAPPTLRCPADDRGGATTKP